MPIQFIQSFKAYILEWVPPKLIGAGFMLGWALFFSTAMAFAKTLNHEVSSLVILFMRCLFGIMFQDFPDISIRIKFLLNRLKKVSRSFFIHNLGVNGQEFLKLK